MDLLTFRKIICAVFCRERNGDDKKNRCEKRNFSQRSLHKINIGR